MKYKLLSASVFAIKMGECYIRINGKKSVGKRELLQYLLNTMSAKDSGALRGISREREKKNCPCHIKHVRNPWGKLAMKASKE